MARFNTTIIWSLSCSSATAKETCAEVRLTIDRRLAGQNHDDELQALVGVLQVAEHGLHLVWARSVLAETRLTHDRHSCVVGDSLQILGEVSESNNKMH